MLQVPNKQLKGQMPDFIISDKVKDYGNDPFFVKKTRESKKFLEKNGFPKQALRKK
jgi:hypothetical protein